MEMQVDRVINDVVVVDLDGVIDPGVKIENIQKTLRIENNDYNFCGFVESLGHHFVAHALRGTEWYSYDDLHPKSVKVTKNSYKPNAVLLVYRK